MGTVTYSPSRLNTFDNCKLKYKYQYIDRIDSDLETIEAFRGWIIHKVLEEFYKLVKGGSVKSLEHILDTYGDLWNRNYKENIKIVNKELKAGDYFEKGRQGLIDYYNRYKPFHQAKIVSTEEPLNFKVKYQDDEYDFYGILDRLDWNDKTDMFEIHDYKVTSTLMTQEKVDSDWQLGLYHIALKEKWPDASCAKLVWHLLLFNKELVSSRTESELDALKMEVIKKIKGIEACAEFSPKKSALCDWCDYQGICPLWKHPKMVAALPVEEYKNEPGVELVRRYAEFEEAKNELKEKLYEIEKEQKKIEVAAIQYAESKKITVIDGPMTQLKIDVKDELRAPTKSEDTKTWIGLREFLIKEKKYEEVSTVNNNMINYHIRARKWPPNFVEKVKKYLKYQVTKKVRLIKK